MEAAALLQGEQVLSELPTCAQPIATEFISTSPCGVDFKCICVNKDFLLLLQRELPIACSLSDIEATLAVAKKTCITALPGLAENRGSVVIGSIVTLMSLATLFVFLRLLARRVSTAPLGWDDWLILLALAVGYVGDFTLLRAVDFGYGRHSVLLKAREIFAVAKLNWGYELCFGLSVTLTKISILFLYHRIFPVFLFRNISTATGIFMTVWVIAYELTTIFSCVPVQYFWDKSIKHGKCIKETDYDYSMTAINIATDVLVLVLPVPWIWKLQMKPVRKYAVLCIFLLGGFVCVAALVRIYFLIRADWSDVTYSFVNLGVWLNVEINLGIVSACLPVLRPLMTNFPSLPPRFAGYLGRSTGKKSSADQSDDPAVSRAKVESKNSGGGGGNGMKKEKRSSISQALETQVGDRDELSEGEDEVEMKGLDVEAKGASAGVEGKVESEESSGVDEGDKVRERSIEMERTASRTPSKVEGAEAEEPPKRNSVLSMSRMSQAGYEKIE